MLTSTSDSDDVLSATLAKMKLKALAAATLDAGGRWAVEFPAVELIRLQVVLAGECWLAVTGEKTKYHLRAGDCVLLPRAKSYAIAADLSIKRKLPAHALQWTARDGVVSVVCNGGGDFLSVGTGFQLDGHFQSIVFGRLPSVIYIPAHAEQAAVLRWGVERFGAEVRNRQAGRALMLSHLAPIMLLQTLRSYLATAGREKNWFVALSDPRLAKAIAAMQSDHARDWSLDALAKTAGLSRAGFALNFKKWIGVTPMEYLAQWRMQLACELLREDRRITEVASAVGYESESAFSAAFTRIVRCRPGHYRRRQAA
ncbi:MAG TPA: AraC family transcriptional regulator [Polyangia bacterium]|jgi:AraC-like DNA-binding protein|nr:AraC family transcriptional regulator [Polyangia bacterium]